MLLRNNTLAAIRDGTITLAFRAWKRPTVRQGGTLKTAVGQLSIVSVDVVTLDAITDAEAAQAGFDSRDELLGELARRMDESKTLYRVAFGSLTADPRIALRSEVPSTDELAALRIKLERMDARARANGGPWTQRVLEVVRANPGVRAGDLCVLVGQDKQVFKRKVRTLKNLGLTESLETGYRLSPRGLALLLG